MSEKKMENEIKIVKGFKVFNPDWTCRDFAYTCPGVFKMDEDPVLCERGFHFCKKAIDCFKYYEFDPDNHIAEVAAHGLIVEEEYKCATNEIEIIREIPWKELLEIVNVGNIGNNGYGLGYGLGNTGDYNIGDFNTGNENSGNYNSGNMNIGSRNVGSRNVGNDNVGFRNEGCFNYGDRNKGYSNIGNHNFGDYNSGNHNIGSGNIGSFNSGNKNVGWWNKTNYSTGCFCTEEPKIMLFNKPSDWTMSDWLFSDACKILTEFETTFNKFDEDYFKKHKDDYNNRFGNPAQYANYIKIAERKAIIEYNQQRWWLLSREQKAIIKSIPNFDKEIFKEITGVDVDFD